MYAIFGAVSAAHKRLHAAGSRQYTQGGAASLSGGSTKMIKNELVCRICGNPVSSGVEASIGDESCVSCGASVFHPKSDGKKLNRANYLRTIFDFERAALFASEEIEENPEDPEAYWNRLLCTYGVKYLKSNSTRTPVCHVNTTKIQPLTDNTDYKSALYYSEQEAHADYELAGRAICEAVEVANAIFANPVKYDVMVCSKECDNPDDDLQAEKIYQRLKSLELSVFYAPVTLKDMDETEKAAHLMSAIENCRVMVACFNNEADCRDGKMNFIVRSYFESLSTPLTAEDGTALERAILPVIRSEAISFQDLPEELVWLDEGYDMCEMEFLREIADKVESILRPESASVDPETIVTATAANKENLVKRAYLFIEDGEFETANSYFEKILDIDIEESRAYIGKLLCEFELTSEEQLASLPMPIDNDKNYIKAIRFASPEQKLMYESYNAAIVQNIELEKKRISEERQRLDAERSLREEMERARKERQTKEERREAYKKKIYPLRNTLNEIRAEMRKTLISPKRKAELKEMEEKVKKNIADIEAMYPDIW